MKRKFFFICLLFFLATVARASLAELPHLSLHVKKMISQEPDFNEILQSYYHSEGLTQDHIKSWKKKIKTAPFLPILYAGYDHSFKQSQGHDITDNISVSSSSGTVTIGPEDNNYDFDTDLGQTARVRAVWKLDEIVFNRNHFLLAREARDLAKVRHVLAQNLYAVYEKRLKALSYYFSVRGSPAKASYAYQQYILQTEKLDAFTGGKFHDMWWREK